MVEMEIIPIKHKCGKLLQIFYNKISTLDKYILYGTCKTCKTKIIFHIFENKPVENVDYIVDENTITPEYELDDNKY